MRVVIEDFGASELARRFGVARYPAVFVNEVLIAKPKDFGFFGASGSQGAGRYTPWLDPDSQARFRADLESTVRRALHGELSSEDGVDADREPMLRELPEVSLTSLDGTQLSASTLREGVTLVEFWATWCPPCRTTLPWLNELQRRYPRRLNVVGIAVESPEENVRSVVEAESLDYPVVLGTSELARDFGDLLAVPTLFVFESGGRLSRIFEGAPADLHEDVERLVTELVEAEGVR